MNRFGSLFAVLFALMLPGAVRAQPPAEGQAPVAPDSPPPANDLYRIRIENALFGRVEVSFDDGQTYLIIGRVRKAASSTSPDATARVPGAVVRSDRNGIALTAAAGQVVKILPLSASTGVAAPKSAITTDIPAGSTLFGSIRPPVGSSVFVEIGRDVLREMTLASFSSSDSDAIVLRANHSSAGGAERDAGLRAEAKRLSMLAANAYSSSALERAKRDKRPILSGLVTLHPKLPAGEPEPITAIAYRIDGDVVSIQNVLPSFYAWDSRRVPDGEHVIEVRALSKYAATITLVRYLVYVHNGTDTASR